MSQEKVLSTLLTTDMLKLTQDFTFLDWLKRLYYESALQEVEKRTDGPVSQQLVHDKLEADNEVKRLAANAFYDRLYSETEQDAFLPIISDLFAVCGYNVNTFMQMLMDSVEPGLYKLALE